MAVQLSDDLKEIDMILYGASGHAKVVIDICEKTNQEITAIIDDNREITTLLRYRVIKFKPLRNKKDNWLISIGNNKIRKKIANKLQCQFGVAIHPNAIIDKTAKIGKGTVVMAGAVVNSSVQIRKHCIVNTTASIDHDCVVSDFAHISPNATLCGGVTVGEGSHIGAGAVIIPNVKIGKWCTIGAGAVILKNIPDGATVVGNPGKTISKEQLKL